MLKINAFLSFSKAKGLLIASFAILLSSCSSNTDDLSEWVTQIEAKPPGRIEPMPEVKEYKPHDYSSSHMKSPFSELEPELESQLQALHDGCNDSVQPDSSRRKEELERFSIDSMEMVGSLNNSDKLWGLLRMTAGASKGKIEPVTIGSYLGINHGQIVAIDEQQIEISTLVPDSKGCWEKRTIYMPLVQ